MSAASEDVKRRICEGFGVTLEEVDLLDEAMGGPELRAQVAGERELVAASVRTTIAAINKTMPPGFTLVWIPALADAGQ